MKISILTLFEDLFKGFFENSILKRAIEKNKVEIEIINFRKFSKNKHGKVDDTPYGGGAGMVLQLQPIVDAINSIKAKDTKVVLLTPGGKTFSQKLAYSFSKEKHIILICGHYEGFDERIVNYIDEEISIGDYVLTGGEIAALVISDAIIRLIPGVISDNSLLDESFNDDLLDYPVYTKPEIYDGYKVPEVLLSGNHKKIDQYRKDERIKKTKKNRNDLYLKYTSKKGIKNE